MPTITFLAAMSSSRSPFVRPFVRPSPFFSFGVFGVLSSPKELQWCFKKVLRVFEVSWMFQVSFKGVYKKCQGCCKEASRVFQGSFRKISSVFQVRLKGNSKVFETSLKVLSGKFQ